MIKGEAHEEEGQVNAHSCCFFRLAIACWWPRPAPDGAPPGAQVTGVLEHTGFLDAWQGHSDVLYARPLVQVSPYYGPVRLW
jgi:hypothetical protein